jgi:hypothetical protein
MLAILQLMIYFHSEMADICQLFDNQKMKYFCSVFFLLISSNNFLTEYLIANRR